MKPFYIFLSIVGIFFLSNGISLAQNEKTNKEVVHKAIDKMNYEFAIAVLKRIKKGDPNSIIEVNQKVSDTTFAKVRVLEPNIKANSIKRMFSKEKLSDGVTGYIYEIDYIKLSSKYYPTDDVLSAVQSLEKIVDKIIIRTKDFGEEQKAFTLKDEEIKFLKERLNKIKNSAISQLKSNKNTEIQVQTDSTTQTEKDSVKEEKVEEVKKVTQVDSTKTILYQINQEDKKELIGNLETPTQGEKTTYKFGLDVKNTDSVRFISSNLDTIFLASTLSSPLILESENNRFIIDLNIAVTENNDYIIWIVFGLIAVSIIAFVMYKQSQKQKPITSPPTKKDILSRENTPITTKKVEEKSINENSIQNQIQEEKNRLKAILTNSKLSDEQKLKEARSKNLMLEVANDAEIKQLNKEIENLSNKSKNNIIETEPLKDESNQENTTNPKVESLSKDTKNQYEPLYVSLSDIGENGISSERKKGMSNTIFVIHPYSEGNIQTNSEAKKADLLLHSDIKDMAFESIFRSIEKLDHLIEHSTFSESAKKIIQEEKGELIKEDNVWKVKKRLKVKFL